MGTASCFPLLPGYVAQPVVTFHDATGRFGYELNLVYGPPEDIRPGIEGCVLHRDLSFWSVSWSSGSGDAYEAPLGRWVNFERARRLLGGRLSFASFCSLGDMLAVVPGLLRMNDLGEEPERPVLRLALEESVT